MAVATLGRAFIFAVYSHRLKAEDSFEFTLTADGWQVKMTCVPEECGPSGPDSLFKSKDDYKIVIPDVVRAELAALHAAHGSYTDRAFQHRLSTIAETVSEREKAGKV